MATRDTLYEEIMLRAFNKEGDYFGQSYDENDILDSSILIMPLVFFMHGVCFSVYLLLYLVLTVAQSDPRFKGTLKRILKTPERGGLTSNVSDLIRNIVGLGSCTDFRFAIELGL